MLPIASNYGVDGVEYPEDRGLQVASSYRAPPPPTPIHDMMEDGGAPVGLPLPLSVG